MWGLFDRSGEYRIRYRRSNPPNNVSFVMWCVYDATWCDVMWCEAMWCNVVRHSQSGSDNSDSAHIALLAKANIKNAEKSWNLKLFFFALFFLLMVTKHVTNLFPFQHIHTRLYKVWLFHWYLLQIKMHYHIKAMVEIYISDMTLVFGWRPYLRNIDFAILDLNNLHQEVLSMQMCSPGSSNYYQNTAPSVHLSTVFW